MLDQKSLLLPKSIKPPVKQDVYDDGFLRVEHENYTVMCAGKLLKFGRTEFLLLSYLTLKSGKYVSGEAIWQYLWKGRKPLNQESLKVFIYRIRRKLKPFGIRIETMVKFGYKIVPFNESKTEIP